MPGESTRFVRTLEQAERDVECARLRGRGLSFTEVGKLTGLTRQGATSAVKRALFEVSREVADEVRAIELGRLDVLHLAAVVVLEARHPFVQNGRVVTDPDGCPIEDAMPRLQAIDRIVRVMERRARLLGLDAPTKTDVRVTDVLNEQIEQLAAELGFMETLDNLRETSPQD